ncbi:MAG: hypothetical protein WCP20_15875 [Desulfuromonadales bacterium]
MLKRTLLSRSLMFFVTVALSGTAMAQDHTEVFTAAQALFDRGLNGSKKDNKLAAEKFKMLSEQEHGNPLYLAYYGSAITIKSRDAFLPWNKLKLGEQGLDVIDKALKMVTPEHDTTMIQGVPVSIGTKLVAISTFLKMPDKYFHRFAVGKSLLTETMNSRAFVAAPTHIRSEFHIQAAAAAQTDKQSAEEIRQLKRALELDPLGQVSATVHARLKELGQ